MTTRVKDVGSVVILAAGQGKRMRSSLPKVLHPIGGKPLLFHVLDQVQKGAQDAPVAIVVGHGRDEVERSVLAEKKYSKMQITFIHQPHQRGTGDAMRCVLESSWGEKRLQEHAPLLVLPGDLPLIQENLISQMLQPLGRGVVLRLLTTELASPTGYGRVVRRGKQGVVLRIVEEKDATLLEKAIREVAASIYLFQSSFLKFGIERLSANNAQGELYLTDLIERAVKVKKKIDVLKWENPEDLRGVNDPWELSLAGKILNERIVRGWALQGVRFVDPQATWVEASVEFEEDVMVFPGVMLMGQTKIGQGALLGPRVLLRDVYVGRRAQIKAGTVAEKSVIGELAQVGPYAHLRPESEIGAQVKVGNFVELKKTRIGEKSSVAHLSYLGDAEVGCHVNIGCGFVTCNFDGRVIQGQRKHRTIIEDEVFLGSDCQTVAPVKIGKGAFIASGSTITEDVEPEALAIARSRQVNKPGYARKLRPSPEEKEL